MDVQRHKIRICCSFRPPTPPPGGGGYPPSGGVCINEYTLPGYPDFRNFLQGVEVPKKCQLCSFCKTAKVTKSGSLFDVDFDVAGRSNSGSEFDHFWRSENTPSGGGCFGPPQNPARATREGG